MKLIAQKFLTFLVTLFGVTLITFFLIRLVPGDPVTLILGEKSASPEMYAQMRTQLGLDQPILIQYFKYLAEIAQGNFGESIVSKRAVLEEFRDRFPATLELTFMAMCFATLLGIPLGILSAVKRNTFWDYSVMGASLVGYSMPIFWWGLVLILVFSVQLGLTPVSGRMDLMFDISPTTGFMLIDTLLSGEGWAAFKSAVKHLILPSIALGTIPLAVIARMTRSSLLEVLREDYIRTAKAKGLSQVVVVFSHALQNALIPVITVIGLMVGTLITGAILTETIFSWPGIGKWLVASVTSRDYPVIQGGVLLIATLVVLVNVIVDILYVVVNPVMRKSE